MRPVDPDRRVPFLESMVVCPRCGSVEVEPLGRVRSALEWHQCRQCRHVWPERDLPRRAVPSQGEEPPADCGKCGKAEARVIGRSNEFVYYQCTACGHTSVKSST